MAQLIDGLLSENSYDQLNARWHSTYRRAFVDLIDQFKDESEKVENLVKLIEYFIIKSNLVQAFYYPNIKISNSVEIQENLFYIIKGFFEQFHVEDLEPKKIFFLLESILKSRLKHFMVLSFGHVIHDLSRYRINQKFNDDDSNRFNQLLEIKVFPYLENCEMDRQENIKEHFNRYCEKWVSIFRTYDFGDDQFSRTFSSIQHLFEFA